MANTCINDIVFVSNDFNCLKNLFNKFRKFMDENKHDRYIKHFIDKHISNFNYDNYFRGSILKLDDEITYNDDYCEYYFHIQTETAWVPYTEVFHEFLRHLYKDKIYCLHCSREPGNELFINEDDSGAYFSCKYELCFHKDNEYYEESFETLEEVYKEIADILNWKFINIKQFKKRLKRRLKLAKVRNEELYCYIFEFNDYKY